MEVAGRSLWVARRNIPNRIPVVSTSSAPLPCRPPVSPPPVPTLGPTQNKRYVRASRPTAWRYRSFVGGVLIGISVVIPFLLLESGAEDTVVPLTVAAIAASLGIGLHAAPNRDADDDDHASS
jgi:hypothetical protein